MRELRATRQPRLFDPPVPTRPTVRLPPDVQEQLRQALVHWMQALATMMHAEDGDDRHHR
jgi:hypothetical protein